MGHFQVRCRNEGLCEALNDALSSPHILKIYSTRGFQGTLKRQL